MNVTIWHNPRCSKSRQALGLLRDKGIEPTIRLYLVDTPNVDELKKLHEMLQIPVIEFTRVGESVFKELRLTKESGDESLLQAMAKHPILIERPIVVSGNKVVVGRPPEAILTVL